MPAGAVGCQPTVEPSHTDATNAYLFKKYVAFHHQEACILSPAIDFSMLRKTLETQIFRLKDRPTLTFISSPILSCNRYVESTAGCSNLSSCPYWP